MSSECNIILAVSTASKNRIDALCEKTEVEKNDDGRGMVVSNSLQLYEDVIAKHEAGGKFLLQKADGTTEPYEPFA